MLFLIFERHHRDEYQVKFPAFHLTRIMNAVLLFSVAAFTFATLKDDGYQVIDSDQVNDLVKLKLVKAC